MTGAAGFIGAAVVRALAARGDQVLATDLGPGAGAPGVHWTALDITDAPALRALLLARRPDAVVHAAALVGVLAALDDPVRMARVNVEGALNLFEAMRAAGVRRCLHISSEEVYGAFRGPLADEQHPQEPVLAYGIFKSAVERLGRDYARVHGLSLVNLRPSWVYGPGLPRNRIPKVLLEAALDGRPLHLDGGAGAAIDHTWLGDVVAGILAALDHPQPPHDAYNLGSGRAVTVGQMAALVCELVPGARLSVGPGPYRYAGRVEMVAKGALDVSRAYRDLGWQPRHDLRAGLQAYLEWMRATRAT